MNKFSIYLSYILMKSSRCLDRNVLATNLSLVVLPTRHAGHSHWQNVRHTKEAKDKERAQITSIVLMQLDAAIKVGGGNKDPKVNSRLAAVIAEAKAKNVPMETINKRLLSQDIVDPYVIEIQAPGGVFVLIETRAKAKGPMKDKVQGLVKKFGFKVSRGNSGSIAKEFFDHIGLVLVNHNKNLHTIDKAMELAIEAGAYDVKEVQVEEGVKYFEFHCEPSEVMRVRSQLETLGLNVYDACMPYVAKQTVDVNEQNLDLLAQMTEKIKKNLDYIENVYDNCNVI